MKPNGIYVPKLPSDTQRAAQDIFGKGNPYLVIGDRMGGLFSRDHLAVLSAFPGKTAIHPSLLVLITIFQFYEALADHQVSEAVRKRLDLRYALHLPLNYPGFEPASLCDFRQWLLAEPAGMQTLQDLLESLVSSQLLAGVDEKRMDAQDLLHEVCTLSRLEKLVDAMFMMLEVLAYSQPDRLREIVLPHWYQRYTQSGFAGHLPRSLEERQSLALAVGRDLDYLLEKFSPARVAGFVQPPELGALRQLASDHYDKSPGGICWRSQCRVSACHWEGFPDDMRRGSGNEKKAAALKAF